MRRLSGKAELVKADGTTATLKQGDAFPAEGSSVKTAPGAKVTLTFSNQTNLSLDEKTELQVDKFQQEPFAVANDLQLEPSTSQSHFTVSSGALDIDTPQLLSGTHMVFETQHASISILNVQSGGEAPRLSSRPSKPISSSSWAGPTSRPAGWTDPSWPSARI